MKRRDVNEVAYLTLQQAIGAIPKEGESRKDEAAKLGRAGGLKGGKARALSLSAKKRKEIAKNAASARWSVAAAKKR